MSKMTSPLYASLLILTLTTSVSAGSFTLDSFYPAPAGVYSQLRLVPQSTLPSPCLIGTLYSEKLDLGSRLMYCGAKDGYGQWTAFEGVWQQAGHKIFLTGSATFNPMMRIGFNYSGAADVRYIPALAVGDYTITDISSSTQDGSIIAKGIHGQGAEWPSNVGAPISNGHSYFIWSTKKSALRAAYTGGSATTAYTVLNAANIGDYSVGFGYVPLANANYSTVSGGMANEATGLYSAVGGGIINRAQGEGAVVGGGYENIVSAQYSVIGGGMFLDGYYAYDASNRISGQYSVIMGGGLNFVHADYSAIGGGGADYKILPVGKYGSPKTIDATSPWSVILGGGGSKILNSQYAAIGGGGSDIDTSVQQISAGSHYSFIGGGHSSQIDSSTHAVILGGGNVITGANYAAIGGGIGQTVSGGAYCFLGGGNSNVCSGHHSSIFGGGSLALPNKAKSANGFIGGGYGNLIENSSDYATVIGGQGNQAGEYAFVGGGLSNRATGSHSMIVGGQGNTAAGEYSWAGGQNITVTGNHTFAWGAHSTGVTVSQNNSFVIFPNITNGFIGIGTSNPDSLYRLDVVGAGLANSESLRLGGTLYITGTLSPGGTTNLYRKSSNGALAQGADLAEIFTASETVSAGDVVVIDRDKVSFIEKNAHPYDEGVVGVVSGAPAIVLEGDRAIFGPSADLTTPGTKAPVALAGRVICKVSLENGPIGYGDLLTTSSVSGHAMKADYADRSIGAIVGKALEPFSGGPNGEKEGTILIFVSLQ